MQSDHELERILQKAPAPSAPFGLEQRLIQQAGRVRQKAEPEWSWFAILRERGWAQAIAVGVVAAGLLTALAFQQNTLTGLKKAQEETNARLSAPIAGSPPSRAESLEHEFEILQKQGSELKALRAEMAEIEALLAEQPQLAAQNAALRQELSSLTKNNPENSPEFQAAMKEAREKSGRIKCVNNLKNVGLAARIWATDNQDVLPKNFVTMKNELSTPRILVCPADSGRSQEIESWEQFSATGSSYEILSPGISEQIPTAVYARCPFHNNVCLANGSVMQLQPEQKLVKRYDPMATYWEVKE